VQSRSLRHTRLPDKTARVRRQYGPMRHITLFTASLALALLAGCHTVPSAPDADVSTPARPAANAATRAASTRGDLAKEKTRLSELFRGTPVVFALAADGSMRVEVPLSYSFDPGKSTVKPPLAAVLDRIAAGQANELTKIWIVAPLDEATPKGSALPAQRAASVRAYLIAKGLDGARLMTPTLNVTALVRLLVTDAGAP
jgi:outer membrane protein OmpA-like peptidoglycan-associated protein